jgi:rubrerythrin
MTVVVTKATGGSTKPAGVLYIEPERAAVDADSSTALGGTGLDAAFTADLLSACLAHERCGLHLYRSVASRTTLDSLRERYEQFGAETAEHIVRLEKVLSSAGGDPQYVSPSARATEQTAAALAQSTFLLTGSVDLVSAELAMLEAVMLAEAKDRANWELLARLCSHMSDGDVRSQLEAVAGEVLSEEEEHYTWARDARAEMLFGLATGGVQPPSRATGPTVDLSSKTRDELYAEAQDLDIAGRSQMTKDQLAQAVAEHQDGGSR